MDEIVMNGIYSIPSADAFTILLLFSDIFHMYDLIPSNKIAR